MVEALQIHRPKSTVSGRLRRLYSTACVLVLAAGWLRAEAQEFALHDGDRVVFYGDSITEQRFYTWWAELYAVTRFPDRRIRFWNAGVGGDRVSGGSGGGIDERLARDVFPHHPTVVTVMLGMNDGSYRPLTPAIEQTYVSGYEHILQSVAAHAADARVLVIGPSAYDDVTRPALFPGGYNVTLAAFVRDDRRLAAKYGATFVDANAPFVTALERANKLDNAAAQLLVPDRVHPEIAAHLIIAATVLEGWHAPALVSATRIDAANMEISGSLRVKITAVERGKTEVRWNSTEEALPMPLGYGHAGYALVKQVTGFTERFNQETLAVTHLDAGQWRLSIDGIDAGQFTAEQMSRGINLGEMDTPMRRQSQSVEWIVRDKGDLQFVRNRMLIYGSDPASLGALDQAEQGMQERIWSGAVPVEHHFLLRMAGPQEGAQTPSVSAAEALHDPGRK